MTKREKVRAVAAIMRAKGWDSYFSRWAALDYFGSRVSFQNMTAEARRDLIESERAISQ